jgi:Circularly permutated YpsA SLOG family
MQSGFPSRIISGGQTGADMGGLIAAREAGLETGGAAPSGWLTEDGPKKMLLESYGLVECLESGYPARTRLNVLQSDGTVIIGNYTSGGSALTCDAARESGKAIFLVPYPKPGITSEVITEFRHWLREKKIDVLNVAGNRESTSPGIGEFTRQFLLSALGHRGTGA